MTEFKYFLFPHTVLPEAEYRHLAVLLPNLHVLQVARQPQTPAWGQHFFSITPTIPQEQQKKVRTLLRAYQNFADLVGEGTVLASISHMNRGDNAWHESRFHLQSTIKGISDNDDPQDSESTLVEAAVFMEMAHNLDLQGLELEEGISKAESLEKEFRNILGITSEEDWEEFENIGDIPLVSAKTYLNFMLPKRIACWLRLFGSSPATGSPVLVTTAKEVAEELSDPFAGISEHIAEPAVNLLQLPLASAPSLSHLEIDRFSALLAELESSDLRTSYAQALEKALETPGDPTRLTELGEAASKLHDGLASCCTHCGTVQNQGRTLSLFSLDGITLEDLWKKFDKNAAILLPTGSILKNPCLLLSVG
ncbi:hypothetical protein [Desulfoferrobacter suflitae]|uniref:hypothetical protein n=1 Tax=Desulfoferrobacter suflitae TaxID=2865782 RepID=UPI00216479D5|nr:hypothetical protein [Desulfoferrobacter suflitae]MCK8600691.1 hypothetical protein [Desulfoferrobacter suflitae]